MAINFPLNPSTNDTYTFNGKTWTFNGNAWLQSSTSSIDSLTVAGNVTAGNILTDNYFFSNGDPFVSSNYGNADVATYLTEYTGNITAGNILTDNYFYANGEPFVSSNYGDNDVLSYLGNISGNVIPSSNITYNLGSPTNQWHSLYVGPGSLYVNNKKVIEDDSGRITVSTSVNQNLAIKTSGSGDIELFPDGTGVINLQGNVQADSGVIVSGTGGLKFGSNLNLDNNNINNLDDPVQAQDAATKAYVDAEVALAQGNYSDSNVASYLPTYTGNLTAGNILTDNYFYANGDAFVSSNYGNTEVATYLTEYAGNITAGNVDVTSNVTASYFLGNGSQLTGIQAGANVTVGNTAPNSPSEGDIWIDTDSGVQLTYFNDGDSSQWVDMQSTLISVNSGSSYGDSQVQSYLENISGNLVPSANVTYNLGSETQRWNTLYLAGNTIDLGGAQIKADPSAGTIALIPQVKQGQTKTKAIVIGSRGISTVDTDTDGNVSAANVEAAATSANTTTGNIDATGVTVTNSLVVNTTAVISGNITAGNVISDNIFFSNGDPFVSGGGGGTSYDEASTSTGYFGLPVGTTAERPGTPAYGMIRFNSNIGTVEIYNSNAWERIGGVISVTGVTPNTFSGNSGTTFTVTGVGFTSGAIVSFITNSSQEYNAGTTTFVSSSQLQASTPRDFTIDDEPLSVKVTNPSGITGVKTAAIDCGGSPTFASASGTLGNIYNSSRSYTSHLDMTATDADGQGVTYSITAGTIPAGLTFNNASGTFSGTASSVANDTTYSFTVTASDGINETSRAFSVTVKAAVTETFTSAGTFDWTSPAGVTKIGSLIMIGGGGGGNAGYQAYGFGGGGAGYVNATDVTVNSSTQYSFTVGAGGLGAIGATVTVAGSDGGDTTAFNNIAYGGQGGQTGDSGSGGSYSVTNGTDNGSAAGTKPTNSGNNGKPGGNNGGGSTYGVGATATGNYTPGNSATGNGNGAGGGSSSQNWIGTRSGNGSGGLISITY